MKKAFLIIILGITCRGGSAFWYFEDTIYCHFQGEELTLYVKKEANTQQCKVYISSLESLMKEKYDEVMLVLQYINQGDDVYYRREVFEIKKEEFLKLTRYRSTILEMISSFEEKFFAMYQESLYQGLSPYLEILRDLELSFSHSSAGNPNNPQLALRHQQVAQQIDIIETILNATSLDKIMESIPSYLYLKQELEWK